MFTSHTQFAAGTTDPVSAAEIEDRRERVLRGLLSALELSDLQDEHNRQMTRYLNYLMAPPVNRIPPSRWQRFQWWIAQPIVQLRCALARRRRRDDWYDL